MHNKHFSGILRWRQRNGGEWVGVCDRERDDEEKSDEVENEEEDEDGLNAVSRKGSDSVVEGEVEAQEQHGRSAQ